MLICIGYFKKSIIIGGFKEIKKMKNLHEKYTANSLKFIIIFVSETIFNKKYMLTLNLLLNKTFLEIPGTLDSSWFNFHLDNKERKPALI